ARPKTSDRKLTKIYSETGGLSGRPLRNRSNEMIHHIYKQTRGALPIIGVGGIFDADDALAKIMSGASLMQIYTSLVYEGPSIAKNIVAGLKKRLAELGFAELKDAVGNAVR
ncbi:MAG: dihydroorotate dehydrogenase (quinone), partial [Verrucomicrobiota bacterium]